MIVGVAGGNMASAGSSRLTTRTPGRKRGASIPLLDPVIPDVRAGVAIRGNMVADPMGHRLL